MARLIRSELLKLASARSTAWMLGLGLVAEALFAGLIAGLLPADDLGPADSSDFLLTGSGVLFLISLVLGSLLVTGEYRHGTANWTLTAEPRRWRVVVAKAGTAILVAAGAGVATVAVNAALALPILDSRGIPLPETSEILNVYAGTAVAFVLIALFGLGLGAVLGNQVATVVVGIVLFTVVGGIVGAIDQEVSNYLPPGAAAALQGFSDTDDEQISQVAGGFVLAAYAAGAIALGGALFARRDITD
jgi:ABC-2 type transport system permease protein